MTRLLTNAKGFEAAYEAFQQINFSAFDYNSVKLSMLNYIKLYYPETFNDYIETGEFVGILELFAYLADLNSIRLDLAAHENFLTVAERKRSILQLAKLISYTTIRNLPARGLAKLESISTTEAVFDSNNKNLAGVTINWNDPDNPNWKEQFILIVNQILKGQFGNVEPQNRIQKDDVLMESYELKNTPLQLGVIPYSIVTNTGTIKLELVPIVLDSNLGIVEKRPANNSSFVFLYATDGQGDNSDTTGFFVYTKQGTLSKITTQFDGVTPNQTFDLELANINETDVWVNNINSTTRAIIDEGTEQGIRSGEWQSVPLTNSQNIAFNIINHRNKYEIDTLEDDQVRFVFGDGQLSDIPKGTFEIWFRTSANNDDIVPRTAVTRQPAFLTYQDENKKPHTLRFTFSLINSLQNGFASETLDQIRRAAPAVYFIQDRMVNLDDHNKFFLQDSSIIKLRAYNRQLAADTKYIVNHDPSETYENVKLFARDGIIYFRQVENSIDVTEEITATTLLKNHIEPLLSTPELTTLMEEAVDDASLVFEVRVRKFFRTGTTAPDETEQILSAFGEPTSFDLTPQPGSFPVGLSYDPVTDTWSATTPPPETAAIVVDRLLQGSVQQGWKLSFIGKVLVARSEEIRFWNVNVPDSPPSKTVDFDTFRPNADLFKVLKENPSQPFASIKTLGIDIDYIVVGHDTVDLGLPDSGLPHLHQVQIFHE